MGALAVGCRVQCTRHRPYAAAAVEQHFDVAVEHLDTADGLAQRHDHRPVPEVVGEPVLGPTNHGVTHSVVVAQCVELAAGSSEVAPRLGARAVCWQDQHRRSSAWVFGSDVRRGGIAQDRSQTLRPRSCMQPSVEVVEFVSLSFKRRQAEQSNEQKTRRTENRGCHGNLIQECCVYKWGIESPSRAAQSHTIADCWCIRALGGERFGRYLDYNR